MSSQVSFYQSIVNSEDFRIRKQSYANLTLHELRKIASGLQINGRSYMKKQQLVDAIMNEWCTMQQVNHQPISTECRALIISGSTLSRCTEYSNNQYCSNHQHRYRLEKPDDCPVCMDTISSQTETPLDCGHWIHKECLIPTNLHDCPVCRQKLKSHEVEYVFGNNHQPRNTYAHNYYVPFVPDDFVHRNYNNNRNLNNNNPYNLQSQYLPDYAIQNNYDDEMDGIDYFNDQEQDDGIQNNYYRDIYEDQSEQYVSPFQHLSSDNINHIIREIELRPRNNPFVNTDSDISQLPNYLNNNFINNIGRLINYFGYARHYNIDDILSEQIRNRLLQNDNTRRLLIINFNLFSIETVDLSLLMRIDDIVNECIQTVYDNLTFSE